MANEVVVHVKAEGNPDRDVDRMGKKAEAAAKRSFLKSGGHAGAAFVAGFIKTITFGRWGPGSPWRPPSSSPRWPHAGGALGVTAWLLAWRSKLASAI